VYNVCTFGCTFVRKYDTFESTKYFRSCTFVLSKVLSYFLTKVFYHITFVISCYLLHVQYTYNKCVRKYFREVLSYNVRKYVYSTCTAVHVYSCTYFGEIYLPIKIGLTTFLIYDRATTYCTRTRTVATLLPRVYVSCTCTCTAVRVHVGLSGKCDAGLFISCIICTCT
jgi:hypothetical protein